MSCIDDLFDVSVTKQEKAIATKISKFKDYQINIPAEKLKKERENIESLLCNYKRQCNNYRLLLNNEGLSLCDGLRAKYKINELLGVAEIMNKIIRPQLPKEFDGYINDLLKENYRQFGKRCSQLYISIYSDEPEKCITPTFHRKVNGYSLEVGYMLCKQIIYNDTYNL